MGTVSGTDLGMAADFGIDFFGLVFLDLDLALFLPMRLAFFLAPFFVFGLTNSCTELMSRHYR